MKMILLFLVAFFLHFSYGIGERGSLIMNPCVVKTIKTKFGDIFDCVHIREQPAFNNPLLKNHKIQMKPSSFPKPLKNKTTTPKMLSAKIKLEGGGCPDNYIPVRRATTKQQSRERSFKNTDGNNTWATDYFSNTNTKRNYAVYKTAPVGHYHGGKATLGVWSLPHLEGHQTSAVQLAISGGIIHNNQYQVTNGIRVGWHVSPMRYGDSQSRFFINWIVDRDEPGYYNLEEGGFVQTNSQVGLGSPVQPPLSTYDGEQCGMEVGLLKDPTTENWWFIHEDDPIGYWPSILFNTLRGAAMGVTFGGTTISNIDELGPPMGSGHFPLAGFRRACAIQEVVLIDTDFQLIPAFSVGLSPSESKPMCYGVSRTRSVYNGLFVGGPGGHNC